jgi:hypothetical protein
MPAEKSLGARIARSQSATDCRAIAMATGDSQSPFAAQ